VTLSETDIRVDDLRTIGIVTGVHGLQGALKVQPLTDFPERFSVLETVFLKRGESVIGKAQIKRIRFAVEQIHMTLRGITNRETAEVLQGAEICVREDERWTLPENSFYISDLIGCEARGDDGTLIGILQNVISGPQDILEISDGKNEYLVPFVEDWVGRISLQERTIVIQNWRRLLSTEIVKGTSDSDDH
jgi:16S rRNA processing protein RimM